MAAHTPGTKVKAKDGSAARSSQVATVQSVVLQVTQRVGSNVATNDLELISWDGTPTTNLQVAAGFTN